MFLDFIAKRVGVAYWRGYDSGIEGAAKMLEAAILADEKLGTLRVKALPELIRSLRHERQPRT